MSVRSVTVTFFYENSDVTKRAPLKVRRDKFVHENEYLSDKLVNIEMSIISINFTEKKIFIYEKQFYTYNYRLGE